MARLWTGGTLRKSRWRWKKRKRERSLDLWGVRCLRSAKCGGRGSSTRDAAESTQEVATGDAVWELPECRWC